MRKQNLVLIAIFILTIFTVPAFAQTETTEPTAGVTEATTPKVSPTAAIDSEVDKLKEKVEQKVLGLKEKNDKATAGVIKNIADSSMIITDETGRDVKITLDSTLTTYNQVAGTSIEEIKKENFKKGDYVFILGPNISGAITANAIYKDTKYLTLAGKITEVDSSSYTISVITLDKTTYTFDIQNSTNQQMLDTKTLETEKIGFSKLKEGDSIHVVVEANLTNPKATRYDAAKLLIIPNEYFIQ